MNRISSFIVIIVLCAPFWSCQKERSGVIDPRLDAPLLITAMVDSSRFNLDSSDTHITPLGSGAYRISASLSVTVSAKYNPGAISRVDYKVLTPGSGDEAGRGRLTNFALSSVATDSSYWVKSGSAISFTVNYVDAGIYHLELTAFDNAGAESNTLSIPITVTRRNIRPRLSHLIVPDTVKIPTAGQNNYTFTVEAADSDGNSDIISVHFVSINPAVADVFEMYDDGNVDSDGDLVSGDGIFSIIVRIQPTNTPGKIVFQFQAQDRSGALSDPLTHTVTKVK